LDNSFTFTPIVSVEEFFNEDLQLPLHEHSLEKSTYYPIIDFKPGGNYKRYIADFKIPDYEFDLEKWIEVLNDLAKKIVDSARSSMSRWWW